jgi:hypothetical protein
LFFYSAQITSLLLEAKTLKPPENLIFPVFGTRLLVISWALKQNCHFAAVHYELSVSGHNDAVTAPWRKTWPKRLANRAEQPSGRARLRNRAHVRRLFQAPA